MATRTKRLAAQFTATTVAANIFTCPIGRTALVRSVWLVNVAGASSQATLELIADGQPAAGLWLRTMASNEAFQISTMFAMNPGDILRGRASTNSIRMWVFGSLLMGEPE